MKSLFLLALLLPSLAGAWAPDAHLIVVRIAEAHLTPRAEQIIRGLIGNQRLSQFASWADAARNQTDWSHTGVWHYVNVSKRARAFDPQDILEAIPFCQEQYVQAAPADKVTWLKFLVHLVGDLHQPLHTGRGDDRGGNDVRVTLRGRETNLHALWDGGLMNAAGMRPDQTTAKLLARADARLARAPFDPADVVRENQRLLPYAYALRRGEVTQAYVDGAVPLIEDRLVKGGLRLASLLNRMLR